MNLSVELTTVLGGLLFAIVWFVRLEAQVMAQKDKTKEMSDKIAKVEEKHDALDNRIVEKLSYIERSLARLEGRFLTNTDKENV
jgi:hypothetical protein